MVKTVRIPLTVSKNVYSVLEYAVKTFPYFNPKKKFKEEDFSSMNQFLGYIINNICRLSDFNRRILFSLFKYTDE